MFGGGFGGLLAGARLREAGVEDVRVIEKGGDFGGTWYWLPELLRHHKHPVRLLGELPAHAQRAEQLQYLESCTPGYYNNEGKPAGRSGQNGFYGGGSIAFIKLLEDWRADDSHAGLELSQAP